MIKKLIGILIAIGLVASVIYAQIGDGGVEGEDSPFADSVWIDDEGNYYSSDNVEGALQEIGSGSIEADTLDSVADRGATTDQAIEVNGLTSNDDINLVSAKKLYIDSDKNSYHYYDSENDWIRFYRNGVEIMRFE